MVLSARVVVNVVDFQSLEADISHGMLPFLVSLKLIFAIFQAFDVAVDVEDRMFRQRSNCCCVI